MSLCFYVFLREQGLTMTSALPLCIVDPDVDMATVLQPSDLLYSVIYLKPHLLVAYFEA